MIDLSKFNYDKDGKIKLHLGCGNQDYHDKGFINVDIRPLNHVDIITDLNKDFDLPDNCVDEIVANSVLEHFPMGNLNSDTPYANSIKILKEWKRVLKDKGTITCKVPNMFALCRDYTNGKIEVIEFFRYIYGAQNYPSNVHLAGFDKIVFTMIAELVDFKHMEFMHHEKDDDMFNELTDWEMRVRFIK
uniref:Putative methyltransferase n=1 Tax=viral metagenome TaxID=1070528 RepID=A0A6M3KUF0_9ZZZZ